jgi:predicted RNase H-like HicB family nuclease
VIGRFRPDSFLCVREPSFVLRKSLRRGNRKNRLNSYPIPADRQDAEVSSSNHSGGIMQIGAISVPATSSTQWNTAQSQSRLAAAPSFVFEQQSAPTTAAQSSAPAMSTSSVTENQSSAAGAEIATIAATYSTTVAGKNYGASVEESGGVYTASVPMPPGLSASGTSIESAELNLSIVLDALA